MCTVKKDMTIADSPVLSDSSTSSSSDYDLLNRRQSQMLLEMIYKNATSCPATKKSHPYQDPASSWLYKHNQTDRAIWDELQRIRATITDMQAQIAKLPQQIVAAFLEADHCFNIRAQVEELEDDEDDFDHLNETSNNKRSVSTSSSDIEVLKSFYQLQKPQFSIEKEIAQLSKNLDLISILPPLAQKPTNIDDQAAKRFVSDLFSHWEARYQTSKNQIEQSSPPTGNIRSPAKALEVVPELSPIANCSSEQVPKLLPYTSTIDLNVWLK